MCFVDTSSNVEIEPDEMEITQYRCADCKTTFRAIGKKIRCPSCDSINVKKA